MERFGSGENIALHLRGSEELSRGVLGGRGSTGTKAQLCRSTLVLGEGSELHLGCTWGVESGAHLVPEHLVRLSLCRTDTSELT